jgi:hypothetical protein
MDEFLQEEFMHSDPEEAEEGLDEEETDEDEEETLGEDEEDM